MEGPNSMFSNINATNNQNDQPLPTLDSILNSSNDIINLTGPQSQPQNQHQQNQDLFSINTPPIEVKQEPQTEHVVIQVPKVSENQTGYVPPTQQTVPSISNLNTGVISNPLVLTTTDISSAPPTSLSVSSDDFNMKVKQQVNTLNEPVLDTIIRDLKLIWIKLKFVINPLLKDNDKWKHIRSWDLWGPLLFTLLLGATLAIRAKEKSTTFILVFMIFWAGSFLVFLNSNLLGAKQSIFQIFCLLGYCMFPLNIIAIVLSFRMFPEILRIIVIIFGCFWSSYSMKGFLWSSTSEDKRGLVIYPAFLLYLFLSGVILMNRY